MLYQKIFSILITFGYANGKDSVLDISPYLKDSNNTNINLNLFDYFLNSIAIDNNIFNYSIVQQVKLLRIPEELNFLLKNFSRYSIYYQLYVREPIYDNYITSAHKKYFITNGADFTPDNSIKDTYEERAKTPKAGKALKIEFKLCHDYCETCNIIGTSIHNQYCVTCLPQYRYDYWSYFDIVLSNCVPEGCFNDYLIVSLKVVSMIEKQEDLKIVLMKILNFIIIQLMGKDIVLNICMNALHLILI